jgi:hypothetical protein
MKKFAPKLIPILFITIVGGLYQIWILLGFSYLAGVDPEIEELFKDGSMFFYAISLIFGVGITWFGLADRSSTHQWINTTFLTIGVLVLFFSTFLYLAEVLLVKKFDLHMWSGETYYWSQVIISFTAIVICIFATVYYETKHSTKLFLDPKTSSVKPLTAAVQTQHVNEE